MSQRPQNYLLQQLAEADFELLRRDLEPVRLESGLSLYEPEDRVDRVYFPENGLVSIISVMISGAMSETSMAGRDSGVGFVEACGSGVIFSRAVVQVPGLAWMAPASRYRSAYDDSKTFRIAIQSNIELQLAEGRQTLACNSLHHTDQRLARWLLDCADASGCGPIIPLTQEFLAAMLSVQRTTVTAIAGQLEAEGLIRQGRGKVEIVDRDGLERRSCECRATIAHLRELIQPRHETLSAPAL